MTQDLEEPARPERRLPAYGGPFRGQTLPVIPGQYVVSVPRREQNRDGRWVNVEYLYERHGEVYLFTGIRSRSDHDPT